MRNDSLFFNAKRHLDSAQEKIESGEYDAALAILASAYSNVRTLLEHVWHMKRTEVLQEQPPGMNT